MKNQNKENLLTSLTLTGGRNSAPGTTLRPTNFSPASFLQFSVRIYPTLYIV